MKARPSIKESLPVRGQRAEKTKAKFPSAPMISKPKAVKPKVKK